MKTKITLKGKLINLRPLSLKDAPNFCKWFEDPEVSMFISLRGRGAPSLKQEKEWIKNNFKTKDNAYFCIETKDHEHIGSVSLMHIDSMHKSAEFGISIGNKRYWGQGMGTEATKMMLDYGFKKLKLHRIGLQVIAYNFRAQRTYQKSGFVYEGRLRDKMYFNGHWHDMIMMGILREEWDRTRRVGK